ncbi:hypothetical protein FACS1894122_12940 [Alphaproteobacteria bacterium]|nr:hypothetical protein FACS1894122_12940 [Alphaproteobacteria bacterium]
MTAQLYLENTYLFESKAHILKHDADDKGAYILLDQTIFYPQGGGQKSDCGKIIGDGFELIVHDVRQVENEIRHYIEASNSHSVLKNCAVKCVIDKDRRLLNARYHTAGHLLGNVVESKYPSLKAQKCHAFPGEAYIEFHGSEMPNDHLLSNALQNAIAENLETKIFEMDRRSFESTYYKLPYKIPENKKFRVLQIGNYLPIPCGGTHVRSTKEIGEITINKMKQKNGILRISFGVK